MKENFTKVNRDNLSEMINLFSKNTEQNLNESKKEDNLTKLRKVVHENKPELLNRIRKERNKKK